jgi:hypothetical protein
VSAAFDEITQSLALRRLELLGREAVGEKRLSSYELPREFRKLAIAASKFLVEVTRPMQLGVSPQLRGFYFVGARPVLVRDVAQASAPRAAQAPKASDATAVFSRFEQPAAPVAAAASGPARKVPEWMFLDRFFTDVVLADRGASSAASGGVRVHPVCGARCLGRRLVWRRWRVCCSPCRGPATQRSPDRVEDAGARRGGTAADHGTRRHDRLPASRGTATAG